MLFNKTPNFIRHINDLIQRLLHVTMPACPPLGRTRCIPCQLVNLPTCQLVCLSDQPSLWASGPLFLNNLPHFTLHLRNNLSPFGCQEKPKASPRIISGSPGVRGRGMAIKPAMIRIDPVTALAAWTTLSIN